MHRVGTSGWSYAGWKGVVYPKGLKQGDWLPFYARHLASVEINASFYRLPAEKTVRGWVERTPGGFLFAVKAWRAITHFRRLADCDGHLAAFFERIEPLGDKCGPVLFQLPPRFAVDVGRLEAFLERLPGRHRHVFEFRDESWHCDAVFAALTRHNAAFCPFELADQRSPRVATADFVYVRLHGREARYRGAYDAAALADWADWLLTQMAGGRDAYVYFDNTDDADHALRNAERLDALLAGG